MAKSKLMVVEDDLHIQDIIRINFELQGFEVHACPKPERALAECLRESPDVIILDLFMPGKNGWEVLEELKSNRATRDVPVVVCSVVKQDKSEEKARMLGAFAYVKKPFDINDIIGTVRRAARHKKKSVPHE